jgi:hypothetical protein
MVKNRNNKKYKKETTNLKNTVYPINRENKKTPSCL